MRTLRFKSEDEADWYASDIERIQRIAAERGFIVSAETAKAAWEDYSNGMAAGWMTMDGETDASIWSTVRSRLVDENGEYP